LPNFPVITIRELPAYQSISQSIGQSQYLRRDEFAGNRNRGGGRGKCGQVKNPPLTAKAICLSRAATGYPMLLQFDRHYRRIVAYTPPEPMTDCRACKFRPAL
jgi:hypothetical protein